MNTHSMTRVLMVTITMVVGTSGMAPAQRGKASPEVQLDATGKRLETRYAREMASLKSGITRALPKMEQRRVEAYEKAVRAEHGATTRVDAAQKGIAVIGSARGLVGHAKGKWIGGAERGIAQAKEMLEQAETQTERDAARIDTVP